MFSPKPKQSPRLVELQVPFDEKTTENFELIVLQETSHQIDTLFSEPYGFGSSAIVLTDFSLIACPDIILKISACKLEQVALVCMVKLSQPMRVPTPFP